MSYCIISEENFKSNLEYISSLVGREKISIGLKSNAYGHGLELIAKLSQKHGIKHAFVNYCFEAQAIHNYFDTVIVLLDIPGKQMAGNVRVSVNALEELEKLPPGTKIELKINTGMNRNGITESELEDSLEIIKSKGLELLGIFTHFASPKENTDFYKNQMSQFMLIRQKLMDSLDKEIRFHCDGTGSLLISKNSHFDLYRIGGGLYGYSPNEKINKNLKPVLSFWANKISSRYVKEDCYVGYGGKFKLQKREILSTYDIGYADGLFRFTEKHPGYISGGKAILGRVSMNVFTTTGDANEVCIFDNAQDMASQINTIAYDVIVSIPERIKKIVK